MGKNLRGGDGPSEVEAVVPIAQRAGDAMSPRGKKALVVFSGGQDSTTCLHWALRTFASVEAVFFDYGQRHQTEVHAAQTLAWKLHIPLRLFRLDFFRELKGNALTDTSMAIEGG